MKWDDASEKILVTMLGHLGFVVEVERSESEDGLCLNIVTPEEKCIIGKNGDRLEDIQYLLNRVLLRHFSEAPRVKVDCAQYRATQEKALMQRAMELAVRVKDTGKSIRTRPLNAYYRRIVHHALAEVEGVVTESPKAEGRYKRVEIKLVKGELGIGNS